MFANSLFFFFRITNLNYFISRDNLRWALKFKTLKTLFFFSFSMFCIFQKLVDENNLKSLNLTIQTFQTEWDSNDFSGIWACKSSWHFTKKQTEKWPRSANILFLIWICRQIFKPTQLYAFMILVPFRRIFLNKQKKKILIMAFLLIKKTKRD